MDRLAHIRESLKDALSGGYGDNWAPTVDFLLKEIDARQEGLDQIQNILESWLDSPASGGWNSQRSEEIIRAVNILLEIKHGRKS